MKRTVITVFVVVLGLFFATVGSAAILIGMEQKATAEAIGTTEMSPVSDVEPGRVAVTGTATTNADSETIQRPFIRSRVLALYVEVEYLTKNVNSDSEPTWVEAFSTSQSVPFVVDDGSGTVRVDASGENLQRDLVVDSVEREFEDVGPVLDSLEAFVDRRPGLDDAALDDIRAERSNDDWRYEVKVLEPRTDVYVLGAAQRAGDGSLTIVADGDRFVVSEFSREATRDRKESQGSVSLLVGALAIGVGLVVIALVAVARYTGRL